MTSCRFLLGLMLLCATPFVWGEPVEVWVSILPQQAVLERVGGDRVATHVLVGPGHSPATYEPTPQQMASLERAEMLITVGVPFESTVVARLRGVLPDLDMVDGTRGIPLMAMAGGAGHAGHGDEGHSHAVGEPDPHFWLDPMLMKVHAETVCAALCRIAPADCGLFEANTAAFAHELAAVDGRIAAALGGFAGREVFVYHASYNYFARRYGLEVVAAESGGKAPGPRTLAGLIDRARTAGVRTIFVQPQFSSRSARALADAVDGSLVELDPLAADYLANLERMAARIAATLGQSR